MVQKVLNGICNAVAILIILFIGIQIGYKYGLHKQAKEDAITQLSQRLNCAYTHDKEFVICTVK